MLEPTNTTATWITKAGLPGMLKVVTIPAMAKACIRHLVEAQTLEAVEINQIYGSEVLITADDRYHIDKRAFRVLFVCGPRHHSVGAPPRVPSPLRTLC